MKTYFKYILAPTLFALTLAGCSDMNGIDTSESITTTYTNEQARKASEDPRIITKDCVFDNRKTVKRVVDEKGIVMRINRTNNMADGYTFILHMPSTNQRLTTCGLPDNMKREGVTVVFSGEEKQIMPDEKWTATPFEVQSATMVGVMPGNSSEIATR